ncbi:NAD(P)H-dependent oxidoreductase [Oxalobacter sp. OttesenSCG-928-P03]|nr:NAD(P)H-dependent oxidoreductase [Oxalobacter sp. OttesenSCG-928-P03]
MKKMFLALFLGGLSIVPMTSGAADRTPKKVLIVYFSLTGNTDTIAQALQKKTGADLFRIETVNPYPAAYSGVTEIAKKELETGNLPALKALPSNLDAYDLILVGSPVWWYTVSTPVMSMLQQVDFQGKKVAAFSTHGGGPGNFFSDFKKQAKNAVVLEGYEVYKPKNKSDIQISESLDAWLRNVMK